MIDLTITARQQGSEDGDGMRLAELERTLAALRRNGATDDTQLDVRTNRAHRVRQVATVGLDDQPAPAAATPRSAESAGD